MSEQLPDHDMSEQLPDGVLPEPPEAALTEITLNALPYGGARWTKRRDDGTEIEYCTDQHGNGLWSLNPHTLDWSQRLGTSQFHVSIDGSAKTVAARIARKLNLDLAL